MNMLESGQTVGGYRVLRLVGRGGMGAVYEVEHVALGVHYALKTFAVERGEREFLRARFVAEGRALARIEHPGIVRVFDLGVLPDGTAYFVMDLVLNPDGTPMTLADIPPDSCTDDDRWRWFVSMASALDCIHAKGIVHRDVKSGNILIDARKDARLIDFGISRYVSGRIRGELHVEETVVAREGTDAGIAVMGTGGYLAPEIRRGEEATAAADVYALGVTFFRLLTGLWYEPGTDALRLLEPLEGPWKEVLPPMLAEDPEKRPQKLSEFLRGKRTGRTRPRRVVFLWCAASVAFAALCVAAFRLSYSPSARPASPLTRLDSPRRSAPLIFDLGEGERIELVECRDAKGTKFWIGASHVTNAEWLRLTGNRRTGGAKVPVCGMPFREVQGLLDELNRRFGAKVPKGMRFRLPSVAELVAASTAGGVNPADASVLGVLGPAKADKMAASAEDGIKWRADMVNLPNRVRTKPPNAWGVYDVVGQGPTICRETGVKKGKPAHVQLGPDDVSVQTLVGEYGWNSTIRLALGEE